MVVVYQVFGSINEKMERYTIAVLCVVVVLGGTLEVGGHSFAKLLARRARMINGKEISIAQAPWHVYVIAEFDRSQGMATCSGSIISSNWVITAGHCACPSELHMVKKFILAGSSFYNELNTFWAKYNDDTEGFRYIINKTVCHPYFKSAPEVRLHGVDDIGLLGVANPFKFDETRQPIPLNVQDRAILAESRAIIYGWDDSISKKDPNKTGQILQYATMEITPIQKCDDFRSTVYHSSSPPDGQICADSIEGKPCSGDSGGSLVINGTLVGIYSWHYTQNCDNKYPIGFVDVASYHDWILNTMLLP